MHGPVERTRVLAAAERGACPAVLRWPGSTCVLPALGTVNQCNKWPKVLDFRPQACQTTVIPKEKHMETFDLETLALLDALEADLDVEDFDADEMLADEA